MSEVLTKVIIDCSTGIETVEPLTAEELAQRKVDQISHAQEELERVAAAETLAALKASARLKLTTGTALTAEEAATIVL